MELFVQALCCLEQVGSGHLPACAALRLEPGAPNQQQARGYDRKGPPLPAVAGS